jgi:hypothetical protein
MAGCGTPRIRQKVTLLALRGDPILLASLVWWPRVAAPVLLASLAWWPRVAVPGCVLLTGKQAGCPRVHSAGTQPALAVTAPYSRLVVGCRMLVLTFVWPLKDDSAIQGSSFNTSISR